MRGILYGGKPHTLDCISILNIVWDINDMKYVSDESVQQCWSKLDNLLPTCNTVIQNNFGPASLSQKGKFLSKDIFTELCKIINDRKLKSEEAYLNTNVEATIFKDSFVTDQKMSKD